MHSHSNVRRVWNGRYPAVSCLFRCAHLFKTRFVILRLIYFVYKAFFFGGSLPVNGDGYSQSSEQEDGPGLRKIRMQKGRNQNLRHAEDRPLPGRQDHRTWKMGLQNHY